MCKMAKTVYYTVLKGGGFPPLYPIADTLKHLKHLTLKIQFIVYRISSIFPLAVGNLSSSLFRSHYRFTLAALTMTSFRQCCTIKMKDDNA